MAAMPYPKHHKARTRARILTQARRLFAAQGYAHTTIEQVMLAAGLTRGGFYAHFHSKAALYREALTVAVAPDAELPRAPVAGEGERWLEGLLQACLAGGDAAAARETPWAFLATDAASRRSEVRSAYVRRFEALAERLREGSLANRGTSGEKAALAASALIVGTLAVALTVDDAALRRRLVDACRDGTRALAEALPAHEPPEYFWAGGLGPGPRTNVVPMQH